MNDRDNISMLLRMAKKDLKAMKAISTHENYEPETFGFHAQQAVEKTLKAWLAIQGVDYSPTHNLRYLLELLQQSGNDVEDLWDFIELNPFAVQYRYEAYEEIGSELDCETIYDQVSFLIAHVENLLKETVS